MRFRLRDPCRSNASGAVRFAGANVKGRPNDNGKVGTENAAERWPEDNEGPDEHLFLKQGPILDMV